MRSSQVTTCQKSKHRGSFNGFFGHRSAVWKKDRFFMYWSQISRDSRCCNMQQTLLYWKSQTWTLLEFKVKTFVKQLCRKYGRLVVASARMTGTSTSCTDNKTQSDVSAERLSSKWNETIAQADTHLITDRQTNSAHKHTHLAKLHVRLF